MRKHRDSKSYKGAKDLDPFLMLVKGEKTSFIQNTIGEEREFSIY